MDPPPRPPRLSLVDHQHLRQNNPAFALPPVGRELRGSEDEFFQFNVHIFRQGKGYRDGLLLLWLTVLQLRFEHLVECGPDGGQVPEYESVCVLCE